MDFLAYRNTDTRKILLPSKSLLMKFLVNKFCKLGDSKSGDILIDAEEVTFCEVEFGWMLEFISFDSVAQFPCVSLFISDIEIS
jgi:hypothetical protein